MTPNCDLWGRYSRGLSDLRLLKEPAHHATNLKKKWAVLWSQAPCFQMVVCIRKHSHTQARQNSRKYSSFIIFGWWGYADWDVYFTFPITIALFTRRSGGKSGYWKRTDFEAAWVVLPNDSFEWTHVFPPALPFIDYILILCPGPCLFPSLFGRSFTPPQLCIYFENLFQQITYTIKPLRISHATLPQLLTPLDHILKIYTLSPERKKKPGKTE